MAHAKFKGPGGGVSTWCRRIPLGVPEVPAWLAEAQPQQSMAAEESLGLPRPPDTPGLTSDVLSRIRGFRSRMDPPPPSVPRGRPAALPPSARRLWARSPRTSLRRRADDGTVGVGLGDGGHRRSHGPAHPSAADRGGSGGGPRGMGGDV